MIDPDSVRLSFVKIEDATMKSGDAAFIIYIDVKNIGARRTRLQLSKARYTTVDLYEVDQDVWLSGFASGEKGISIASASIKRAGLVFYKNVLKRIAIGDRLSVLCEAESGGGYKAVFQCISVNPTDFDLIEALDYDASSDCDGLRSKFDVSHRVERFEIMEEKVGIAINGVNAVAVRETFGGGNRCSVTINFDIAKTSGVITPSFEVRVAAYGSNNTILDTGEVYFSRDSFLGFDAASQADDRRSTIKDTLVPRTLKIIRRARPHDKVCRCAVKYQTDPGLAVNDETISGKSTLSIKINTSIDERSVMQVQAANILRIPAEDSGDPKPQAQGISLQRLMRALTVLSRQVEVAVTPSVRKPQWRISVAA